MKSFYKILLLIFLVLAYHPVFAKIKINIYDHPRDLTQKQIISTTGKQYALSDFKGQFVVAVFWSRYCAPCLRELKSLSNFAAKTYLDGIRVILISPKSEWIGGNIEHINFMKRFDADNLETFVDEREAVASSFGIFSSPITILINRSNQEIGRIRGSIDWDSSEIIEYIYRLSAEKD